LPARLRALEGKAGRVKLGGLISTGKVVMVTRGMGTCCD
jgi:hypothetical protein